MRVVVPVWIAVVCVGGMAPTSSSTDSTGSRYPATQPCQQGSPLHSTLACDPAQPIEERLDSLISQLSKYASEAERAALLQNAAGAIESLNIGPYQWWNEALHGGGLL